MNTETYYSLLKFVPPEARKRMVIAGGYAAAPETAGDIDLWILADEKGELYAVDRLCEHLRKKWAFSGGPAFYKPDAALAASVNSAQSKWAHDYGDLETYHCTVDKRNLHILITPHKTAQELVDSFDISTHAIALKGACFTFAKFYTSPTITPYVSRFNQPHKTLERLQKICARYGLKPRPDQLARLEEAAMCESVVDGLAA